MSPKDKVRANIYKELLEEEKIKHQRYKKVSLSLFFVGILGTSSYYNFIRENLVSNSKGNYMVIIKDQPKEEIAEAIKIDHFFNKELFNEEFKINLDSEHVFGFDFQS